MKIFHGNILAINSVCWKFLKEFLISDKYSNKITSTFNKKYDFFPLPEFLPSGKESLCKSFGGI